MDVELRTLQRSQVATVTTVTTVTRAEQDTMEVDENWGYPLDFGTPQMECGIHPMPSPCHKSPMLSMIAWCLETVGFPFLLILGMVYSRVYHITSIIHYLSVGLRCFLFNPWCLVNRCGAFTKLVAYGSHKLLQATQVGCQRYLSARILLLYALAWS